MWLEYIGEVSGCCCKEVYTVDFLVTLLIPTPLALCSLFVAASLHVLFVKCFIIEVKLYFNCISRWNL